MIRYQITKVQLEAKIEEESPGWLAAAAERLERFRKQGFYKETGPIWSKAKPVYMRLQGVGKCVYCERKMESLDYGKIEQDVEHFRPKGNIKAWKAPRGLTAHGIKFTSTPKAGKGYYLLPYHPFNYAAACKPCNSALKKDYFPIAGSYSLDADDPADLKTEEAYLIYPIGSLDDDPEELIEFHGPSPRAVADTGHKRNRAIVTIEFFKLDDPAKRKILYRDRSLVIMALFPMLQKTQSGTAMQKSKARMEVDSLLKPDLQHLNCARSFVRLFEKDPAEAQAVYDGAVKLATSTS